MKIKFKEINNFVTSDAIKVSVIIVAYNHQQYMDQTLSAVLEQKTNFEFEVIIHDDCTPDLPSIYYEELIKDCTHPVSVIHQCENQVGKKNGFDPLLFAKDYAKGKYIAICEGDDYWIDSSKLQRQFDFMENNTHLGGCFHPAYSEKPNGERAVVARHSDVSKIFSAHDVIIGDGAFCPTASLFLKKTSLNKYTEELLKVIPCGDYFTQVLSACPHGLGYLNKVMSVYRINQENSFTSDFSSSAYEKKIEFYARMRSSLLLLKGIVGSEYTQSFEIIDKKYKKIIFKFKKRRLKEKLHKAFSFNRK